MALQCLLEEPHSRRFITFLRDVALKDLALVIDRSPQVMGLAIDLYEHLIDVPAPVTKSSHPADPLPIDIGCKQRAKPVPPMPHRFMADVDTAFCQQVLDVSQA